MAHVFERFLRDDYVVKSLTVEKNTKKSVKETIQALNEFELLFRKKNVRYIVKVDATVLSDEEKIAPLVAYSLFQFRNISSNHMSMPVIKLHDSYSSDFDQEDYRRFVTLRGRGGAWEEYLKVENVNWVSVNACMRDDFDELIEKLQEVTNRYQEVISKVKEERVELKLERKFSFNRYATSLDSLYNRCFDEVSRILHPSIQYNPSPSFQRDLVWSLEKKQRFIESVINEIPIGSFYVNVGELYDPYNELGEGFGGLVWDGKQRLHALHSFILGEFDVEVDGKRVMYLDNPGYFNIRFDSCGITIFESRFDDLQDVIHAYVTINQAQVKHTDEDLQKAIDYLQAKSEKR